MVQDVTSAALHSALRGLSTRRRVIANNVANIETPGYLAGRASFETSIQKALDNTQRGRMSTAGLGGIDATMETSAEETRLNGNNVNLDDEILAQTQTELAYSMVLEAMNGKFRLLRTAIREGG